MTQSFRSLAPTVVLCSMLIGAGAARPLAAESADVIVVSGTLDGQFLSQSLFHVGDFWIRAAADTVFSRWLSDAVDKKVVVTLSANPARFEDAPNVRILSGTLVHETAPKPTPATVNVIGELPEGNSPVVHILFLKDETTGTLGALTFETSDVDTAAKFDGYDGKPMNIVIKIK